MTETRAEKARRLLDEGRVFALSAQPLYTAASVRGDQHTYRTILYASGNFSCTCEWGRHHFHTDDLCAHALAVKLMAERSNP